VAVRAIGDSVMVSAAGALQERLGASGYIDAGLSRQFADGIAVARGVREQGGASVVVIHLGNNGPVRAAEVDAVMGELVDVPAVLFVNVRVSARWQDAVNQTLAEAVGRHPNARLVDWHGASAGHPEWFQSDGTHFRTVSGPGANAYADLIAGAVAAAVPPPTTMTTAPTTTITLAGIPLPSSRVAAS
jgi:lysophospholipase L1-like esterase